MNTLYYGDNLDIMKEHIKDESIDLIYLDPPYPGWSGFGGDRLKRCMINGDV
ncbi:MAG: hypothetical protein U1C51_02805 [Candidatus Izemoplasmatales bacterium]|nr:hypothetical protein [Candidatus Izemoplasmatales bacterium]